jgi:hypothetical protein
MTRLLPNFCVETDRGQKLVASRGKKRRLRIVVIREPKPRLKESIEHRFHARFVNESEVK